MLESSDYFFILRLRFGYPSTPWIFTEKLTISSICDGVFPFLKLYASEVVQAVGNILVATILFEQPYCRISTVMDRCGVSRPTAASWLNSLAENEMLQTLKVGRDRLFINREFLQLLVRQEPLAEPGSG